MANRRTAVKSTLSRPYADGTIGPVIRWGDPPLTGLKSGQAACSGVLSKIMCIQLQVVTCRLQITTQDEMIIDMSSWILPSNFVLPSRALHVAPYRWLAGPSIVTLTKSYSGSFQSINQILTLILTES